MRSPSTDARYILIGCFIMSVASRACAFQSLSGDGGGIGAAIVVVLIGVAVWGLWMTLRKR